LKCNKEHLCCNNCFGIAVNFSVKLNNSAVACPVFSCDSFFSEEIVEDNITGKIYKKLSSFTSISKMNEIKKELMMKDEVIKKCKEELVRKDEVIIKNEEVIKNKDEEIKNKDAELKTLRKEIEDLGKFDAQSNSSSSSSTPSKNIINNSKGSFCILSDFIYYFVTCVFDDILWAEFVVVYLLMILFE
jgi:hypothetical protein